MELGLKGKRAFVSGGTLGIGRGIAETLAAEGVHLFLTARDAGRLEQTAAELAGRYGILCRWAAADYGRPGDVPGLVSDALAALGGIDILVNNAGRSSPTTLETPPEDWYHSLQVNLLSHLAVIHRLIPLMKESGWGRIINIAGVASRQPDSINAGGPPKLGLVLAGKVLSRELAPHGITVNTVAVGKIESYQINELHFPSEGARAAYAERHIPAGRFGKPEDVAAAVVFLASERAGYITGASLTVDGGQTRSAF